VGVVVTVDESNANHLTISIWLLPVLLATPISLICAYALAFSVKPMIRVYTSFRMGVCLIFKQWGFEFVPVCVYGNFHYNGPRIGFGRA